MTWTTAAGVNRVDILPLISLRCDRPLPLHSTDESVVIRFDFPFVCSLFKRDCTMKSIALASTYCLII